WAAAARSWSRSPSSSCGPTTGARPGCIRTPTRAWPTTSCPRSTWTTPITGSTSDPGEGGGGILPRPEGRGLHAAHLMTTPADRYAAFRDRQADPEFASFRALYDFEFDDFQ